MIIRSRIDGDFNGTDARERRDNPLCGRAKRDAVCLYVAEGSVAAGQ